MHVRRTQLTSEGIPFPFRLARVSFPRLTRGAIAYDVDGGFLSITEDPVNVGTGPYTEADPRPNGMTFRCPKAINGNMGLESGISRNVKDQGAGSDGETMRAHIEKTVGVLNQSFADTYATTTRPQLDLTAADFTNTSMDQPKLQEVNTKTLDEDQDTALWEALYKIVGDSEGEARVLGSQLENLAKKRNEAAHADIRRMLKGVTPEELKNEIIEIVRFPRLPVSRYSKYLDYGTGINRILEDGSRSMTAKLEKALKERSVEILKTIINSYTGDGNGRAVRVDVKNYDVSKPAGKNNLEPDVPRTSTMPEYTINEAIRGDEGYDDMSASIVNDERDGLRVALGQEDAAKKNNELLRFWRSYSDEIQLKEGLDVWKFAIFEWEPYIRAGANDAPSNVTIPGGRTVNNVAVPTYTWPDVFPSPEWKNSFVQSRLVDPRYTIATSFMLDDDKIQQYWAWAPERPENVKSLMMKFHDGVKNQNLAQFESHRIDTFDILSGFNTADNDVAKLLLGLRGITYDIFNKYRPDAGVIQQINRKVLPVSATGRNKITIDVRALGASELRYLSDLPEFIEALPTCSEATMKTVWAYTVDNPRNYDVDFEPINARSVAASGIDIDGPPNDEEPLRERFLIQTETSNFKMRPIVAPVINKILKKVRRHINNRPISELTENEFELRQFEEKFTNWFRPKTNVYLQHIFGQALNNALTPAMIGSSKITNDVVLAYRTVAQKLLDSIAFAHNLGLREALHVFHVDVCNRLIKIAQTMDDPKTEAVMKQVAYAVCVEHPVVGLDLEAKRRSYKTISANVDVLRNAVKAGDANRQQRIKNSPAFVNRRGWDGDYPDVMPDGDPPNHPIDNERTTEEEIWKNYDYWALVLLDEDYFKFHTYGTAGIETVTDAVDQKKNILGKLTHGGEREFDLERAEPELSDILNPSAARYEDSDQVNKRMGGRPRKEGDAPKRTRKEARKNIRKNYAGLR